MMRISLGTSSALLVSTLLVNLGSAQSPIYPTAPFHYGTGNNPRSVATGDLNHDGHLDIVTVNEVGTVSVLLGLGDGTYGSAATYTTTGVHSIAIGDVNGDQKLDVVTAGGPVSVLLGTGTGSLGAAQTYAAGGTAESVAIGDLNGDGMPDLVVAHSNVNTMAVLLNVAATFPSATTFALGTGVGTVASSIRVADVNADGFLDCAVGIGTLSAIPSLSLGYVSILTGNGTGGFASNTVYNLGYNEPRGLAIGDVNGDGALDVVTANLTGTVAVVSGLGAGYFGTPSFYGVGTGPYSVAIGDVNGDAVLDIVTANFGLYPTVGNSVSVVIGTGAGSFANATSIVVGSEPMSAAVDDVNKDGRLDILAANYSSNSVSVLVNGIPGIPGIASWGQGSWGCSGQLSLNGNSTPSIGNLSFAVIGASAPHSTLGLLFVSDALEFNGSDLFGVNILIYATPFGASEFYGLNAYSGPSGEQFAPFGIPAVPALAGKTYYAQSFWVEPIDHRCTTGVIGLESSRGLAITVQP